MCYVKCSLSVPRSTSTTLYKFTADCSSFPIRLLLLLMFSMSTLPLLVATLLLGTGVEALWPLPQSSAFSSSGALRLSNSFQIKASGQVSSDLMDAIARTEWYLKNDNLERLVLGRGSGDVAVVGNSSWLNALTLSFGENAQADSIANEIHAPLGSRDEAYYLYVPADGSDASLSANSSLGLFRGLTTFSQLWYTYQGTTYTLGVPIDIHDYPAYPYRGLTLDTARNYFPVADIMRQIDAMSWVKMSQFHWHVVDSQSFPLVVPGYETISQQGAYAPSYIYTPQDVADIVAYAGARAIDVIIEIDTPGHTSIIHKAFPEHVACPESTPWATYANEPPAGQLRLASAATTNFTAGLLSSVATMFPSPYMSTGGDEINLQCYIDDPQTQAALNASGKTFEQALDTFTQVTHAAIQYKGKTPVVWEEMVLVHNVTLSNDTVVMVWISSANAAAVAAKGFRVVHSPSDYFYLDCGGGGWLGSYPPGNSWCDPFKTWQKAYSFDPLANITSAEKGLILGGQQLLWTEQSGPSNVDPIVWPRAAASAEVFWSGGGGNGTSALPRLHEMAYRMINRGIRAIPLQPMWCALRPYACDLTA